MQAVRTRLRGAGTRLLVGACLVSASACAGLTGHGAQGGPAGDAADAAVAFDLAPAQQDGSGTLPEPAESLEGYWMQSQIGDCIASEEWIELAPGGRLTHTIVDRNACGPHRVTVEEGTWAVETGPSILTLDWQQADGGRERRRFTFAVVASRPGAPAPGVDQPGYRAGTRLLTWSAYQRGVDTGSWRRVWQLDRWGAAEASRSDVTVTLSFPTPFENGAETTPCRMVVDLDASLGVGADASPEQASERFDGPCQAGLDADLGWVRIAADGFEQSTVDGSWSDWFAEHHIWERYSAPLASLLYDAFRPVLFYQPGVAESLFHDVSWQWYVEMETPPPAAVD